MTIIEYGGLSMATIEYRVDGTPVSVVQIGGGEPTHVSLAGVDVKSLSRISSELSRVSAAAFRAGVGEGYRQGGKAARNKMRKALGIKSKKDEK